MRIDIDPRDHDRDDSIHRLWIEPVTGEMYILGKTNDGWVAVMLQRLFNDDMCYQDFEVAVSGLEPFFGTVTLEE